MYSMYNMVRLLQILILHPGHTMLSYNQAEGNTAAPTIAHNVGSAYHSTTSPAIGLSLCTLKTVYRGVWIDIVKGNDFAMTL